MRFLFSGMQFLELNSLAANSDVNGLEKAMDSVNKSPNTGPSIMKKRGYEHSNGIDSGKGVAQFLLQANYRLLVGCHSVKLKGLKDP